MPGCCINASPTLRRTAIPSWPSRRSGRCSRRNARRRPLRVGESAQAYSSRCARAISVLSREPLFSPFDQASVELDDINLAHASPTGKSNAPERLAYCTIASRNSGVQP